MKQQQTYNKINIDYVRECAEIFYLLEFENRKLKISDLSYFTSEFSPLQHLRLISKTFKQKKAILKRETQFELRWILDKYFRFFYPDDWTRSGLIDYFEFLNEKPTYVISFLMSENPRVQKLGKKLKDYIDYQKKIEGRGLNIELLEFIEPEDFRIKEIQEYIKEYMINTLKFHLANLFIILEFGTETYQEIVNTKKKSSFNFTRKPEDLKNIYQFLIDESYIKEISFDDFSLCFSGQELQKPHLLEWNKRKVLLAYFINSLRENDFINFDDEHWQKTDYCFKNLNINSIKSSFNQNPFPKGFEGIKAFFDNY